MKEAKIPFGEKVRGLLRERGITQEQFELDTGISRRTLYDRGRYRKATITALACYLEEDPEDLVAGTTAE